VKKILIVSANPTTTDKLRLDEEVREIQDGLQRSRSRDKFELITKWAVRPDDLRRALLDHNPHIIHFSGHGGGNQGLALENNTGEMQMVSTESLARLFKLFKDKIECVLLNACYSEVQAESIHQHINCVVGMNRAIGDRAAIKFAVGFYDALVVCQANFARLNSDINAAFFGEHLWFENPNRHWLFADYVVSPKRQSQKLIFLD
jgi:hypothetical protein